MPFSSRTPDSFEPNEWFALVARRRAAGARLLDLTEMNPTHVGLRSELASPEAWNPQTLAHYAPDPRGALAAREAVARYYVSRGAILDPEDVVLTAGTSEAYAHLFRLLANFAERVLVPRPGYPLFESIAEGEYVGVDRYPMERVRDDEFMKFRSPLAVDPLTRAVVLVQPGLPTGVFLEGYELQMFQILAHAERVAVISDEVFADFVWPSEEERGLPATRAFRRYRPGPMEEARPTRIIPTALRNDAGLTFVLSGASKVCGLPQMKIGWIAIGGPEDERREARERLEWMSDLFLTVSTPAQLALPEWLANRHMWQHRVRERIATNLTRLDAAIRRHPKVRMMSADAGWAAAIALPTQRTEAQWTENILERDVIVHPGHFYDFVEEPVVVLSLIVEPDVFARGLDRIEEALHERG